MELVTVMKQCTGSNIYVNYNQYIDICNKLDIPIIIYSAEFNIKDTKNISRLRNFLSNNNLFKPKSRMVSSDYTFQILDGVLEKSTKPLERNIQVMRGIFPIFYFLIACIGFILSYLTGRLEKRTLFIQQSMGTAKWFRFFSIFIKQVFYSIIGALLGSFFLSPKYIVLYLCSYWIGTILSILRILFMNYYDVGKE